MRMRHYTGFWTNRAIVPLALAFYLTIALTACQNDTNGGNTSPSTRATPPTQDNLSLQGVFDSLSKGIGVSPDQVQEALGPHGDALQAKTKEEVDKLFRWEYRVIDLPAELSAEEMEKRLAALGSEGWECFSILPAPSSTRTICKRRPKSAITYLKFLPGL
jgi:hypothetical protein